jgi:nitronate monooxygenase
MDEARIRAELGVIRQRTDRPFNLNFFCHTPPAFDPAREARWRARLKPYYVELGLDPDMDAPASSRTPFDAGMCALVEEFRPAVVSFHFGLPEQALLDRVKAAGARIIASATTVEEAVWLESHGCDAIIAQGAEAGGHRGNFLGHDMATQIGTFSLVPQVVDAVKVPVIAAGGVTDARGIAAAFALGAAGVQIGTAYLYTPEARIAAPHRKALREAGPLSDEVPAFPLAGGSLAPLRAASEKNGSGDFMSLWAGQSARLAREMGAAELTRTLAAEALSRLGHHTVTKA